MALRKTPVLTLREALVFAGGVTADADRQRVVISRGGAAQPMVIDLDLAEKGDAASNIAIQPDDAIYVERLASSKYVRVEGAFMKPGTSLVFSEGLTLSAAILAAGGPTPFAKLNQGFIIRHESANAGQAGTTVLPFDWKQIIGPKRTDIPLKAGDSIWMQSTVPSNNPNNLLNWLTPFSMLVNTVRP